MEKKKFVAMSLAVLMVMVALAGCSTPSAAPSAAPAETAAPAAPEATAAPAEAPADTGSKASYTLDKPVTLVLASQGAGTDDYITTALESQYFTKYLPAGSQVTQETISSGCSSIGYLIEADMADFGTGQNAMSATVGLEGKPAYTKVNALIATSKYPFTVQLVTSSFTKKTGYKSIREVIENKYPARICAEPIGSSDYVSFIYIMDILGCTVEEFEGWGGSITYTGGSACCDMLQDGQADLMIAHTTATSSSIVELCMSSDVQAFGFDEEIVKGLVDRGYAATVIPAGTYDRFPADAPSACQASSKVVSADLPNEVAYALTKILCEHKDELSQDLAGYRNITYKDMTDTEAMVVPMHPGALAYFQDIGVLDANGNYIGEPAS